MSAGMLAVACLVFGMSCDRAGPGDGGTSREAARRAASQPARGGESGGGLIPAIDIGASVAARSLVPLSEYDGRIEYIVIHVPDEFLEQLWTPMRDLLAALPLTAGVSLICNSDATCAALSSRLASAGFDSRSGVHVRRIPRPMLIWSRDRYIGAISAVSGESIVMVPQIVQNFDAVRRAAEREIPKLLRQFGASYGIADSPLILEGGNVLNGGRHVLVGANVMRENLGRLTEDQTRAELARTFKPRVMLVADGSGLPPVSHIDMFITVVDEGDVLVGSPRLAGELMSTADESSRRALDERLFIRPDMPDAKAPDFSPERCARFDQVAAALEREGYRVRRLPYVDCRHGDFIVSYNNVLQETIGGRRVVYMPTYGIPALDEASRRAYESMGMSVRPIDTSAVCHLLGAIRCMANVIGRGTSADESAGGLP
ncbi:MAG: agmatine deiminase family protein [Phycisphaerae bacterium]|nr:agmatine deiminase family protein [Phycisphaerae bacterium]